MPESSVQTLTEFCQAWCCDHCPGEPVPVANHTLGEEPFPDKNHMMSVFNTVPGSIPRTLFKFKKLLERVMELFNQ